jgi:hypothetical protein
MPPLDETLLLAKKKMKCVGVATVEQIAGTQQEECWGAMTTLRGKIGHLFLGHSFVCCVPTSTSESQQEEEQEHQNNDAMPTRRTEDMKY